MLEKTKAVDLKPVHGFLFGVAGQVSRLALSASRMLPAPVRSLSVCHAVPRRATPCVPPPAVLSHI